LTELKLEAEFGPHPDSLARRPVDPAMGNSFGSYWELGTWHDYQAETFVMVRDDDVDTPELRRRRNDRVRTRSHSGAQRGADYEKEIEAAEAT